MSAPPAYPEAMATSRPYDDVRREEMLRLAEEEEGSSGSSLGGRNSHAPPTYDVATTVSPSLSDSTTVSDLGLRMPPVNERIDGLQGTRNTVVSEGGRAPERGLGANFTVASHPIPDVEYSNNELVGPLRLSSAFAVTDQSEAVLESRVELSLALGLPQAQWCKVSTDIAPTTSNQVCVTEYTLTDACGDSLASVSNGAEELLPRNWDSFGSDDGGDSVEIGSVDQCVGSLGEQESCCDSTSSDTAMLI